LRSLNVDVSTLKLATVDQLAMQPIKPIKPKKALILALGLVLGGMLGLFIALLRNMLQRKPESYAQTHAAREPAYSL
jgi:LPS O-antigen subunit length determinant protein (WzzB/FepE family)